MQAARRLLWGGGVILVGVCAAWPYRLTDSQMAGVSAQRPDLDLRGTDLPVTPPAARAAIVGNEPLAADSGSSQVGHPPRLPTTLPRLEDTYHPLLDGPAVRRATPSRSNAPPPPQDSVAPTPPRRHRVRNGDSLQSLARQYLGGADRDREIFEANRNVLVDPDVLPLGKELVIPPRGPAAADSPDLISVPRDRSVPAGR